MFTRQHYEKLAQLVGGLFCEGERSRLAGGMAEMFAKDNPLFKRDKWLLACNVRPLTPPKKCTSNRG